MIDVSTGFVYSDARAIAFGRFTWTQSYSALLFLLICLFEKLACVTFDQYALCIDGADDLLEGQG